MTEKIAREKQIVVVLVGVLAVTVLFGPAKPLRFFGRRAPAPPITRHPEAPHVLPPVGEARAAEQPAVMAYTARQVRDPFESLLPVQTGAAANEGTSGPAAHAAHAADAAAAPRQSSPPPALQLQGVVWGGPVPRAIINHRVYGVGDVVEGARVKAIERQQVVLEFQGAAITLTNAPEPRSRTPSPGVGMQPEGGG